MPAQYHRGQRAPPASQDEPSSSQQTSMPPPTNLERPRECINKFPTPPFSIVCEMMDRMRNEDPTKKKETLKRLMGLWREKVGLDMYPLIRLLLPDRDRERPVYNLKEQMLAKCYIEALGLDPHSPPALRMIKWKEPLPGQVESAAGDFARVCYHEIAARSTVELGELSVQAVNSLLDELASGRKKKEEYVPILKKINRQCTAAEQEWIIRIILKDLRISMRERGVFSCLHPEAADLFNVCSDLKRVCWTLYKPEIRLSKNQTNIELFRSFLPQLCYRSPSSSHEAIAKLVGAPGEFIMEEKLDGERMQLHMRGSGAEWFYCSRKAKDYTYLYGAHPGLGSLTQFIGGAFKEDVRNVILDGEMLVWDPILEKYLAFGTLKSAAGDKVKDGSGERPCFKIFDILYLNDKCLTHMRLSERKRLLKSGRVFNNNLQDHKGRMEFAEEQKGKSGKDIRAMLDRILETKGEGLVVKRVDATYSTNSRGADWVKVKPEYSDQMGENLDLLVLGGWWGKGGRTGKISSLLCGLRVPQEDDGTGETPHFQTFIKVGSGMSYEDYTWIMNKPPPWLEVGETGLDDKPDVYINPEDSFVIEVKAAEIVPAIGNYACGYTLRFPRCRFIHYDRASRNPNLAPDENHPDRDMWNSLSLGEFVALLSRPSKRYADAEGGSFRKKRKVAPKKKVNLISSVKGQQLSEDTIESMIFHNITFYIPRGSPQHSKAELEELVHTNGGDFTQAQLSDLSALVISHDLKSPLVKAQMRKKVSIIKPEWLIESIKRRKPLPLIKDLLIFAGEDAIDGRYFNKTLEEIDNLSLVRDRGGVRSEQDSDAGSENEGEESESVEDSPAPVLESSPPEKPQRQLELEDEWGLGRREAGQLEHNSAEEDEETDDERFDREDYQPEENNSDGDDLERTHGAKVRGTLEEEGGKTDDAEMVERDEERKRLLPLAEDGDSNPNRMGGSTSANEYDDDQIFCHLVFYIDTPENAELNGLTISKSTADALNRLMEAEELLKGSGGRIVTSIDDPELTHIIQDDEDSARYAELVRRTVEPKRKHIVLPSWVVECVEEETLMNEDGHKPK
ncbi:DNA ligase 4, partial [Tremellales sp. Uapishka_1]